MELSANASIYERLCYAQNLLKAPKSKYNSFGKYSYRSAEDILEAAKPVNMKAGLALVLTDEPVFSEGWHYIASTATVYDSTGAKLSATGYAREDASLKGMHESQITGATSSFARKYALNALYCIDDTKDTDDEEYHEEPQQAPKQAPAQQQDPLAPIRARFHAYADARHMGSSEANLELCKVAGVGSLRELTPDRVQFVLDYMERCIANTDSAQEPEVSNEDFAF